MYFIRDTVAKNEFVRKDELVQTGEAKVLNAAKNIVEMEVSSA